MIAKPIKTLKLHYPMIQFLIIYIYSIYAQTTMMPPRVLASAWAINPLLTKLARSRWLDIGQVLFLRVYGPGRSRDP